MRVLISLLIMTTCLVGPLYSETSRIKKKAFWISVAAVGTASFLDVHSSYGKAEANSLARSGSGRLGLRGVGIKLGTAGLLVGFETLMEQRYPEFGRKATIANFALSGAWTSIAVRNYGVARPPASWRPATVPSYLK
jgi:hypothetical protein